jgi:hypothetical protein
MSYRRDRDFLFDEGIIPKKSIGCEIGVWKGEFSCEILFKTNPEKLILIDPWLHKPEYKERWYGSKSSQDKMDKIYKDVCIWHGTNKVVDIIRGTVDDLKCNVDWIYIDGDHSEEPCYKDLVTSYPYVKKMFIVDDYEWDGVKNAVKRFKKKYPNLSLKIKGNQAIITK